MSISFDQLPERYQKQALRQVMDQESKKLGKPNLESAVPKSTNPSKFHNVADTRKNLKFQSKHEADRFDENMLRQKAGVIRKLKLQVSYTLVEGYTTTEGLHVNPLQYRADFVYEELHEDKWEEIVEDAKGRRTQLFIDKKKQMFKKYGIDVREV